MRTYTIRITPDNDPTQAYVIYVCGESETDADERAFYSVYHNHDTYRVDVIACPWQPEQE